MPVRSWSDRRKEAATAPKFTPLEPGVYNFVIKQPAEVSTNPNTNKTRWSIKATVEDGPRANATQFHDFYDSDKPKGIDYLLEQFSALGLDSLIDTEPTDEAIGQALLGRRFTAEVYNDTYNGKVKQKLRNLRAPSGPPVGGALGAPVAGSGFGAGPGGPSAPLGGPGAPAPQAQPQYQQPAPQQQAPQAQQPYQQAQPQQQAPQYQQAPAQPQQVQQQVQPPQAAAASQPPATENPWATGGAPPLPQF